MDKELLKLNEFCKMGNLEEYRLILEGIFEKIYQSHCKISARYDGGPSIHEFRDASGTCHIRIPLLKYSGKPVEAIWVILHEFGHHLSGPISRSELKDNVRMAREELAWKYAREQLAFYPELIGFISDFDEYASKCLKSHWEYMQGDSQSFFK